MELIFIIAFSIAWFLFCRYVTFRRPITSENANAVLLATVILIAVVVTAVL